MKEKRNKTREERVAEINFGKMIKKLREEYGYTQEILVDKTKLTTQTISNIENHGQNVGIDTIVLFAKAFNMTLTELFTYFEECYYGENKIR